MEVRPACPASWPCPSTNHPRAIGNRGSPAGSAGYSKQDLNRSNTKSPWSENRGDRTYKEGVGGSSPSAPTGFVEKPGHFAALEAVGECPCRALSLSFHGEAHLDLGLLEEFRFDWELVGKAARTVDDYIAALR